MSKPLRLENISYYKAPAVSAVKPYIIAPRTQLVEIVTAGTVYFRSKASDLKLGCGALFWHRSGEKTIYRTDPAAPYECLVLRFRLSPGISSYPRPARLSLIPDGPRTLELCSELLRSFYDASVDREALGHYAQARLLWEIHLGRRKHALPYPASLEVVRAFVEKQFSHASFGVAQIAQKSGVSEAHLYALFRKHLGRTPHQMLTERRLQEGKLLLISTTRTIKDISAACGFLNIETFYRAFRKHVGVTPFNFRQTHRHPLMQRF